MQQLYGIPKRPYYQPINIIMIYSTEERVNSHEVSLTSKPPSIGLLNSTNTISNK